MNALAFFCLAKKKSKCSIQNGGGGGGGGAGYPSSVSIPDTKCVWITQTNGFPVTKGISKDQLCLD